MPAPRFTSLDKLRLIENRPAAIFIDDGGVLNDNARRGPQWQRLIGEFMPQHVGGSPEAWSAANPAVFRIVWSNLKKRLPEFKSHSEFHREYATRWMRGMCESVGVSPQDDAAELIYIEMAIYISSRVAAAIDDAVDGVRYLYRTGYPLFMASGTPSWELRGILTRMGIVHAFVRLYGPDLVDKVKYGPGFYTSIFAASDVVPGDALVIESDAECCRWANEAGARSVWIDPDGDAPSLAEVAKVLVGTRKPN